MRMVTRWRQRNLVQHRSTSFNIVQHRSTWCNSVWRSINCLTYSKMIWPYHTLPVFNGMSNHQDTVSWAGMLETKQRWNSAEEVYEDVLSDYKSKTVTVDPHPLTGTPTVSIHPCQHAQVMKKVIDDWIEQGLTPRHDLASWLQVGSNHSEIFRWGFEKGHLQKTTSPMLRYASLFDCIVLLRVAQISRKLSETLLRNCFLAKALFVFLKFISSVVPTINYDFTMEIEFWAVGKAQHLWSCLLEDVVQKRTKHMVPEIGYLILSHTSSYNSCTVDALLQPLCLKDYPLQLATLCT